MNKPNFYLDNQMNNKLLKILKISINDITVKMI